MRIFKQIKQYIISLKKYRLLIYGCFFLLYCALLPLLINNKPLVAKVNSNWIFPLLANSTEHRIIKDDDVILPLCYYLPSDLDFSNTNYVSPFLKNNLIEQPTSKKHWLGTDYLGRDVLSMFCYGIKNSIIISVLAVILSGFIGVSIGLYLGYFQTNKKISALKKWSINLSVLYGLYLFIAFVAYSSLTDTLTIGVCLILCCIICSLFVWLRYVIPFLETRIKLALNSELNAAHALYFIISSLNIIPNLLIYVFVLSYLKPTMANLIFVFAFTNFADIALIIRAEVIKLKHSLYIEACYVLGYSKIRIVTKHILPNIWPSITLLCALNVSTIILTESGLSFLGLGLTQDTNTIGTLLNTAKNNVFAWWITVPCILFIFGVSLFFNSIYKSNTRLRI